MSDVVSHYGICGIAWMRLIVGKMDPRDDNSSEQSVQNYAVNMACYGTTNSHVSRVRMNWLNHNFSTATLLQARIQGQEWTCPPEITIRILQELEAKLADISTISLTSSRISKSSIIRKLIEERDHILTSLKEADIDPNLTASARNFFQKGVLRELHQPLDPPIPTSVVRTSKALLTSMTPSDLRDMLLNVITVGKTVEELELTIARLRNENELLISRLKTEHQEKEELSKEVRRLEEIKEGQKVRTNKDLLVRAVESTTNLDRLETILRDYARDPSISTEKLIGYDMESMIPIFYRAFHPRPVLMTGNRQDLIRMREEYFETLANQSRSQAE